MHIDSIIEITHYSTLFVGLAFEENFDITAYRYSKISISDKGITMTAEKSLLSFKDERILSYILAEAALRFMILHEIGHHINQHISSKNEKAKFALLMATDKTNIIHEVEADTYASKKLAEEYKLILKSIKKSKKDMKLVEPCDFELLALNILIGAMTLPYSLLYVPESAEITKDNYESTISYREIFAILNIGLNLFHNADCRNSVLKSLMSSQSEEVESIITAKELEEIKNKRIINFNQFMLYIINNIFSSFKQMYYTINKIGDKDYYLNNYIKVIEFIRIET